MKWGVCVHRDGILLERVPDEIGFDWWEAMLCAARRAMEWAA